MFGMQEFRKKGYLNLQDEHESVSKTLEYGYDDFCVAQIARQAGQIGLASSYDRSSLAYRNLMDKKGFMHPRSNGQWEAEFDPRQGTITSRKPTAGNTVFMCRMTSRAT